MARHLCSNNVPRVELDHRARDARLKLNRIEQLLSPRATGKGFDSSACSAGGSAARRNLREADAR